jgi:hypothetical protein
MLKIDPSQGLAMINPSSISCVVRLKRGETLFSDQLLRSGFSLVKEFGQQWQLVFYNRTIRVHTYDASNKTWSVFANSILVGRVGADIGLHGPFFEKTPVMSFGMSPKELDHYYKLLLSQESGGQYILSRKFIKGLASAFYEQVYHHVDTNFFEFIRLIDSTALIKDVEDLSTQRCVKLPATRHAMFLVIRPVALDKYSVTVIDSAGNAGPRHGTKGVTNYTNVLARNSLESLCKYAKRDRKAVVIHKLVKAFVCKSTFGPTQCLQEKGTCSIDVFFSLARYLFTDIGFHSFRLFAFECAREYFISTAQFNLAEIAERKMSSREVKLARQQA